MGDQADEDEARYYESLAVHESGDCDCDRECEFPLDMLQRVRKEVRDMNLERDRTFGDDLMGFLERRKKKGRASKFLRRWRSN